MHFFDVDKMDNSKVGIIRYTCDSIGLIKSWRLHWHLSKATEIINQVWSIQLFLWISKLFLYFIVKTYCVLYKIQSNWRLAVDDAMLATLAIYLLFVIIISCHITSNQVSLNIAFFIHSFLF